MFRCSPISARSNLAPAARVTSSLLRTVCKVPVQRTEISKSPEAGLKKWRQFCRTHVGNIRPHVLPLLHPESSFLFQNRALIGDKILHMSLVTKLLSKSEETRSSMKAGEYTIRAGAILSNKNMQQCGEKLLVPDVISKEEWATLDSERLAGTSFEAAVGSLYEIEGEETPTYKAVLSEILDLLVETTDNQPSPKHPKSAVLELGGSIKVKPALKGYQAVAYLGDIEAKGDGPFLSKKEAELAACIAALEKHGYQGVDAFPKPKKLLLDDQRIRPVGEWSPINYIANQSNLVINRLNDESVDDWVKRKLQKNPREALRVLQIAAASGESNLVKEVYSWNTLLRDSSPNDSFVNEEDLGELQATGTRICATVAHLVLCDGRDIVVCGHGESLNKAGQSASVQALSQCGFEWS